MSAFIPANRLRVSGDHVVHINALGELTLSSREHAPIHWRATKARSLFGILLINQGRVVGKERLQDLLWPQAGEPGASLKVAVHSLRKALNTYFGVDRDYLRIEYRDFGYTLSIGDNVIVDCHELERHTTAARDAVARGCFDTAMTHNRQAAALYSGDFFSGEPDGWVDEHRQWLRALTLGALDALAEYALTTGDLPEVAQTCRRVLAIDTTNEAAFRRLMMVHAYRGELDAAEQWYQLCARRLREQFELDPDQRTRALLRRVLRRESIEGYCAPAADSPLLPTGPAGRAIRIDSMA